MGKQLRQQFGAAAGTSAALARPPSRPRRVPGGPVAGDWEPSPARPRAGAARGEETLAAAARPLGQRPPRRPFWALGPGPLWPEPGPASGLLGTRRCRERGHRRSHGSHLCAAPVREEVNWGRVPGRLYVGWKKQRVTIWLICPLEIVSSGYGCRNARGEAS